jgi:hypothetical protein
MYPCFWDLMEGSLGGFKMKKYLLSLVFGLVAVAAANTAFARSHVGRGTVISGELFGRVGLCWTDLSSSSGGSTSSSSDTRSSNYGIVFAIEPGNSNEIAADIYSLDSNQRKIKQVGHADVTATNTNGAFSFSGAADSPSQFSLTLTPQNYSSGQPREYGMMSATLANATLFSGDTASNVALKCDVSDLNRLPTPNPSASPTVAPSTTPSVTPTIEPSPTPTPSSSSSVIPSGTPSFD